MLAAAHKFYIIISMQSFPQPARLNVFKNDQDTWDYTNPNLSGQGNMQPPLLPYPFFLLLFLCYYMGCLGFFAFRDITFDHKLMDSAKGSKAIFLRCHHSLHAFFSPHSRRKVRA